jgi:signal transduction histidine kinase
MIPSYRTDNPKLTRQQLQSLMAELGQQLRQPLTVVNGGVDMILSGHFGKISEAQRNIIQLISDSAAELDTLVGRLIEIAGIPESLTPGEFAMPDPTSASPSKLQ